jgi:F-type H+-transporting ATPase subunit alpha
VPVEDIRRFDAEFLSYIERAKPEVFETIRTTTDLSDDTVTVLEKAIAEFKKQFTTSAGHLLVNDEPVSAVADSAIDPTKITRQVRG